MADDDLIAIAAHLPFASLLQLASTCKSIQETLLTSRHLWRSASIGLLGEPLVGLHLTAWKASDTPRFHRRLVRAATSLNSLAYANRLRKQVTLNFSEAGLRKTICTTGHTASACVPGLVAVIGGWRPACPLPHLHIYVIDVIGKALRVPSLDPSSIKPSRRMRHASAVVKTPPWATLPAGSPENLPSVLVLGGACDGGGGGTEPEPGEERGEPVKGGLLTLTLLSFCATDGGVVKWQETHAAGSAPGAIWHHQCAPFDQGRKVVVFGGDMPSADPEFEHIATRAEASHVYVLNVAARLWERVSTTGSNPSWRSLHVGLACRPGGEVSAHRGMTTTGEALLILGGSAEHVQPFSSGEAADFKPYLLDLDNFSWRTQSAGGVAAAAADAAAAASGALRALFGAPELNGGSGTNEDERASFEPTPRMRFAAEAFGQNVLVYSGHGNMAIPNSERILRLDLNTLRWRRLASVNSPVSFPDTPAACLAGGVLIAGVQMSGIFGVRPCAKFDLLCLAEPPEDDGMLGGDEGVAGGVGGGGGEGSSSGSTSDAKPAAVRWEGSPRTRNGEADDDGEADKPKDDDDDDDDDERWPNGGRLVTVQLTDGEGETRTVRLPLSLVAQLRAMQAHSGDEEDEDESDDEEEAAEEEAEQDVESEGEGQIAPTAADADADIDDVD